MSFENGYALIISTGTNLNGTSSKNLECTLNDADSIALALKKSLSYPEERVKVLCGANATKERIEQEFENSQAAISSNDQGTLMVFFSGHGIRKDGKTLLIPYGYEGQEGKALNENYFRKNLLVTEAKRIILFFNIYYSAPPDPDMGFSCEPFTDKWIESKGNLSILSVMQDTKKIYAGLSKNSKKYTPFGVALFRGICGKGKEIKGDFIRSTDIIEIAKKFLSFKIKINEKQQLNNFENGDFEVGRYSDEVNKDDSLGLLDDDIEFNLEPEEEVAAQPQYQQGQNFTGLFTSYGPQFNGTQAFGNHTNLSTNLAKV